uniref:Vta1 C-terminal domain-containing protein n=1 Tax=Arcella intermedia TaxID=1963864 RepID=A0A6B2LP24_9EUKA
MMQQQLASLTQQLHNQQQQALQNLLTQKPQLHQPQQQQFQASPALNPDTKQQKLNMLMADIKVSPQAIQTASEHTRYALSALHFDDVHTAVHNIKIALNILLGSKK